MPSLFEELKKRVLIVDGAMGSLLQAMNLTKEDFGGKHGCNDYLCLTRPEVIKSIHRQYFAAGADIVETNTFGGSSLKLNEYGIGDKVYDLNFAAAKLAKEVAAEFN